MQATKKALQNAKTLLKDSPNTTVPLNELVAVYEKLDKAYTDLEELMTSNRRMREQLDEMYRVSTNRR